MIGFENDNKDPNKLHDFLIAKDCVPIFLGHNAKYSEDVVKIKEATEIYIEIEEGKEQELTDSVNQFMTQLDNKAT